MSIILIAVAWVSDSPFSNLFLSSAANSCRYDTAKYKMAQTYFIVMSEALSVNINKCLRYFVIFIFITINLPIKYLL